MLPVCCRFVRTIDLHVSLFPECAQVKCKTRDTTSVSVHSAWLCHVDSILERWPGNTKVIIVERAQEEVVSSLLEIAGNTCCWMEHDGTVFDHDEYADAIYPKFEMHEIDATATWQSLSLSADTRRRFTKAAAEMYVDWYRAKATELAGRHPDNVKMLPVSELLAGGESQLAVLTWLGIAYPVVESVLQYPTTSYPGSPSITADTLPPPMVDTMTWPPAVTCEGLQGLLSQHVPLTPLPSVCDNVGILAIEPYIPMLSVKQTEMEIVDGVSPGKYTIGLGQKSVACCSEAEDAVSMVLTAVATLVRRTGITADRIGYVVVAGESMVDKAKPVATRLLRLEVFGGRVDAEVFDVQAACASGTIGLLQACRWAESYNAGRHGNGQKSIAIVAMSDIMLYPPGPARPTSGAGAVAMLVGCNAPLRVDLSHLVSHARDENDFLKFQLASEYATVNGEHSKKCYLDTLEHCAKSLASVVCADADVGCGASSSPLLDRVSRVCVHSPYHGITRKAAQRLGCTIGDTGALDCKRFDQLMAGGAMLGKETGNACSASLFLALVSTVRELSLDHVGERILMYSYGSGLSASLFEIEIRNPQAGEFKLCDLQQSAEDSISQLLIDRVEVSPQDFVSIIDSLEGRSRDITQGLSWSCPDRVRVRKSTWYLAECDGRGDRRYECL